MALTNPAHSFPPLLFSFYVSGGIPSPGRDQAFLPFWERSIIIPSQSCMFRCDSSTLAFPLRFKYLKNFKNKTSFNSNPLLLASPSSRPNFLKLCMYALLIFSTSTHFEFSFIKPPNQLSLKSPMTSLLLKPVTVFSLYCTWPLMACPPPWTILSFGSDEAIPSQFSSTLLPFDSFFSWPLNVGISQVLHLTPLSSH